jgi:hypothetical protein
VDDDSFYLVIAEQIFDANGIKSIFDENLKKSNISFNCQYYFAILLVLSNILSDFNSDLIKKFPYRESNPGRLGESQES